MYNIAIEVAPEKYIFVTHNNPSVRPMEVLAKTLTRFEYEKVINPDAFTAHLLLTIAGLDSKKRPSFYVGVSPFLGENSTYIYGISFVHNVITAFDEAGNIAVTSGQGYGIGDLIRYYKQNEEAPNLPMLPFNRSDIPPTLLGFKSFKLRKLF